MVLFLSGSHLLFGIRNKLTHVHIPPCGKQSGEGFDPGLGNGVRSSAYVYLLCQVCVCVCVCVCVHVCVDQSAFREQESHQLFEKREFNIKNC